MSIPCFLLWWFLFVSLIGIATLPRDTIDNKKVINILEWTVVAIILALTIIKIVKHENPPKAEEKIKETNLKEAQSQDFKSAYLFCLYKRE